MRKYLTVVSLMMSCGSEDGGVTQVGSPATAADVIQVGFDEGEQAEATAVGNRFRPCGQQSDCASDEQCVIGVSEPFQMCLKSCATVDECEIPGAAAELSDAQAVTCRELQGAARCVLSCDSADRCPDGMECVLDACVWR